jgi:hypothetical protein
MHLPPLSLSDKYGLFTAVALVILILLDNTIAMIVVAVIGLAVGGFVAWKGEPKRVAWISVAAFAVTLAFGVFSLLR